MKKIKFLASQFTATKFEKSEAKAKFCNQFVRFVESGFTLEQFPKWFYTRLSMTFGHIAHYDQMGFYQTFFTNLNNQVYFLQKTLEYGCWGSPEFTYCDAEKAIQHWLRDNEIFENWEQKLINEIRSNELAQYEKLKVKFG